MMKNYCTFLLSKQHRSQKMSLMLFFHYVQDGLKSKWFQLCRKFVNTIIKEIEKTERLEGAKSQKKYQCLLIKVLETS